MTAPPPPDALVARALRALTRALLVTCTTAGALGLAATAALALGGTTASVAPLVTVLALGQGCALAGAVVVGLGLGAALRGGRSAPAGQAEARGAAAAGAACGRAGRRLGVLVRLMVALCVVAVAGWALAEPASGLGALVGAFVAGQAALVLAVVGRRLVAQAGTSDL